MHPVHVFDDGLGLLAPLTDLRAAFDVRTGALTTLERFQRVLGLSIAALHVPEPLAAVTREIHAAPVNELGANGKPVFLLNGRWAVPPFGVTDKLTTPGSVLVDSRTNSVHAALVSADRIGAVIRGDIAGLTRVTVAEGPQLLSRPWHVRTCRDLAVRADLGALTRGAQRREMPGVVTIGQHPIAIEPGAHISPTAVLDSTDGPIAIAANAVVRPLAIIVGPASIGPHATILEHALIKPNTAIGPHCKCAGEIGGTIFQGHANKAHDGHLGDSWVGQWVNLGAGTTNSNLLNTYGEVVTKAAPGMPSERTGEQFLGAIIGDHVKTAICTRLMTGVVIHTGAMLAQSAPVTDVIPAFAWCTDDGTKTFRLSKFLDIAKVVMARRKVTPSAAYLARLEALADAPRAG